MNDEIDSDQKWWHDRLFMTLTVAVIGLIANFTVTLMQNHNAMELAHKTFQYDLVIEAIKTDDPKVASKRLTFFIRLGFLDDPDIQFFVTHPNEIPLNIPDKILFPERYSPSGKPLNPPDK